MFFLLCKRAIENQQIRRCSNYYAGIAAISGDYFYSDSAKERVFCALKRGYNIELKPKTFCIDIRSKIICGVVLENLWGSCD